MRPGFPLVIALLGLHPAVERQAGDQILEEILLVEDRRAEGKTTSRCLPARWFHPDQLVVRRAAQAIGRLERPRLAELLFPFSPLPVPAVRSTAVEAIAGCSGFPGRFLPRQSRYHVVCAPRCLRARSAVEQHPEVRGMLALARAAAVV